MVTEAVACSRPTQFQRGRSVGPCRYGRRCGLSDRYLDGCIAVRADEFVGQVIVPVASSRISPVNPATLSASESWLPDGVPGGRRKEPSTAGCWPASNRGGVTCDISGWSPTIVSAPFRTAITPAVVVTDTCCAMSGGQPPEAGAGTVKLMVSGDPGNVTPDAWTPPTPTAGWRSQRRQVGGSSRSPGRCCPRGTLEVVHRKWTGRSMLLPC